MAFAAAESESHDRQRVNPLHQELAPMRRGGGRGSGSGGGSGNVAAQMAEHIEVLNKAVADLSSMLDKIGTKKDTHKLRKKMKKKKKAAMAASTAIRGLKPKLSKAGLSKSKLARINKDLSRVIEAYSKVASELEVKERLYRVQKQESDRLARRGDDAAASKMEEGDAGSGTAGQDLALGLQSNQNVQIISDVDLAIIQEREREAEAIQRDAVGLHEITADLATLVNEQGEQLATVEANVNSASQNVKDGIDHLEVATTRQKAYRKKLWIMMGCGFIIIVAVLVPTLLHVLK